VLSEESVSVDVKIPTEEQILENPKRAEFVGGGWVDSSDPSVIYVYWHRHQWHFTVYSLLQVLEHETLHSVLARLMDLETSKKLDNIHRSVCVWLTDHILGFVDEFKIKDWVLPAYVEEPAPELLE
jgi:hypothetical protein